MLDIDSFYLSSVLLTSFVLFFFNFFPATISFAPVVLYGCETWSLTLREERTLRVFENRVLRRVFGPKRDGVTGEWRRLHNESFMICTPQQILFA
jgi:hypothetical protein